MIRIQVTYLNKSIQKLIVEGHANSDTEGHDLVCAAVSAVTQGGVQALTDEEGSYCLVMKKGYLELARTAPNMSEHDETVLETIVVQLESIAQVAPDYVQLERKQK